MCFLQKILFFAADVTENSSSEINSDRKHEIKGRGVQKVFFLLCD